MSSDADAARKELIAYVEDADEQQIVDFITRMLKTTPRTLETFRDVLVVMLTNKNTTLKFHRVKKSKH